MRFCIHTAQLHVIPLCIVAFCPTLARGTDVLPGNVAGIWTAAESPHHVRGTVTVPSGARLIIEAGATVYFTGSFSLEVYGDLFVLGTEQQPVVISSGNDPHRGDWKYIRFYGCGSNDVVRYARIEGADQGIRVETEAGRSNTVAPLIEHCEFRRNKTGILVYGNAACQCFSTISTLAEPTIRACEFRDNEIGIQIIGRVSADYHYPTLTGFARPRISNCVIEGSRTGVLCETYSHHQWNQTGSRAIAEPILAGVIVRNCERGLTFTGQGASGNPCEVAGRFSNLALDRCGTGVYVSSGGGVRVEPTFFSTTVVACTLGVRVEGSGTNAPAFHHSAFWRNAAFCQGCVVTLGRLDRVNANGDSTDLFANLRSDPRFVDAEAGDHRLGADSPCIDAGDPSWERDACRPPALGTPIGDIGPLGGATACGWQGVPAWSLTGDPIAFERVPVGSAARETLTILNTGTRSISIGPILVRGPDAGQFTPEVDSLLLDPGGEAHLVVRFVPQRISRHEAELVVHGDAGSHAIRVNGFGTDSSSAFGLTVLHSDGSPGDTVLVPIEVHVPPNAACNAVEVDVRTTSDAIAFLGVDLTGTPSGLAGWVSEVNREDQRLRIALGGAQPIAGNGILIRVITMIRPSASLGLAPIEVRHATFDTGDHRLTLRAGGVMVTARPTYRSGDVDGNEAVQAYDAVLVLKHLSGSLVLRPAQIQAGDLSSDGELSAWDASLILRRVVGLPDPPQVAATGGFRIDDGTTDAPGALVDLPIWVEGARDLYAFETTIAFDQGHLRFEGFVPATGAEGMLLESHGDRERPEIQITGAVSTPVIGTRRLGTLRFRVQATTAESTRLVISKLRLNEGPRTEGASSATLFLRPTWFLNDVLPNPARQDARVFYGLAAPTAVELTLYDIAGRRKALISSGPQAAGAHFAAIDCRGLASGVYFVRFTAAGRSANRRFVVRRD